MLRRHVLRLPKYRMYQPEPVADAGFLAGGDAVTKKMFLKSFTAFLGETFGMVVIKGV